MEIIFISIDRNFNNGMAQFRDFIFKTKYENVADRLRKCNQLNKYYIEWKEEITPPLEYINQNKHSITWEELDEYKTKKFEKQLFAGDDVHRMADLIIENKYQELIADFLRSFKINVTKLDKITLKNLLISAVKNNKISRYELAKFHNKGHRPLTEEQYAKLKEEDDGNYIKEIIQ